MSTFTPPPTVQKDGYKIGHPFQYPANTQMVYNNATARSSRVPDQKAIINFSQQAFVEEYLVRQWRQNFFEQPRDKVLQAYGRRIKNYLGRTIPVDHVGHLHDLGFLPLIVKALPEGVAVPLQVPFMTCRNTHDFGWLTNFLETIQSAETWQPITSATTAFRMRKILDRWALLTVGNTDFVPWQAHDFSMRGMPGLNAAMASGAAHLLFFTGTDTIPAIDWLEEYYGADSDAELVGGSVDATEHAVMMAGGITNEYDTFLRLLTDVYPTGVLSVVSDTWDYWDVVNPQGGILARLKDVIMQRDGKLVIRPDSGDQYKIINGNPEADRGTPEHKGTMRCLEEIFGSTLTAKGFRLLDPHVGAILGDGMNPEKTDLILGGMAEDKFASTNLVLGVGSYTYQYVTRDTYSIAIKATYARIGGKEFNLWKDPKTDLKDFPKKSARGLLQVRPDDQKGYVLHDRATWAEEQDSELQPIFVEGKVQRRTTLKAVRANAQAALRGPYGTPEPSRSATIMATGVEGKI